MSIAVTPVPVFTMTKLSTGKQQSVSDTVQELERLRQQGQILEDTFEAFTKEVNSRTKSNFSLNGCDKKSVASAHRSSSMFDWLFFWRRRDLLFFWRRYQNAKTYEAQDDQKMVDDQIIPKDLEESMRIQLKDNKELIANCLRNLSEQEWIERIATLESKKKQLLKEISKLKEKRRGLESNQQSKWYQRLWTPSGTNKRQVTFQLYCQQQADLVSFIVVELGEELTSHLSKDGVLAKRIILLSATDIAEDLPLIVICLHASRLGPDISDAIRDIQSGPNVAVVIVHHKDFFALPTERSDQILQGNEYSEMGAFIDIGFLEGKGIYQCDVNKNAIKELAKFIIDNNKQ